MVVGKEFGDTGVAGRGLSVKVMGGNWGVNRGHLGEPEEVGVAGGVQLFFDIVIDEVGEGFPVQMAGDPVSI